jgi:hypothetical protein
MLRLLRIALLLGVLLRRVMLLPLLPIRLLLLLLRAVLRVLLLRVLPVCRLRHSSPVPCRRNCHLLLRLLQCLLTLCVRPLLRVRGLLRGIGLRVR